jgi:hypothetical protein
MIIWGRRRIFYIRQINTSRSTSVIEPTGKLVLDLQSVNSSFPVQINITSAWQSNCLILSDSNLGPYIKRSYFQSSLTTAFTIIGADLAMKADSTIDVTVPENCDIDLRGNLISVRLINKVHGNLTIISGSESQVHLDKCRGDHIQIQAGTIVIKECLEGNPILQCKSLRGKLINANLFEVQAERLNLEALYARHAKLTIRDDATMHVLRGSCEVVG